MYFRHFLLRKYIRFVIFNIMTVNNIYINFKLKCIINSKKSLQTGLIKQLNLKLKNIQNIQYPKLMTNIHYEFYLISDYTQLFHTFFYQLSNFQDYLTIFYESLSKFQFIFSGDPTSYPQSLLKRSFYIKYSENTGEIRLFSLILKDLQIILVPSKENPQHNSFTLFFSSTLIFLNTPKLILVLTCFHPPQPLLFACSSGCLTLMEPQSIKNLNASICFFLLNLSSFYFLVSRKNQVGVNAGKNAIQARMSGRPPGKQNRMAIGGSFQRLLQIQYIFFAVYGLFYFEKFLIQKLMSFFDSLYPYDIIYLPMFSSAFIHYHQDLPATSFFILAILLESTYKYLSEYVDLIILLFYFMQFSIQNLCLLVKKDIKLIKNNLTRYQVINNNILQQYINLAQKQRQMFNTSKHTQCQPISSRTIQQISKLYPRPSPYLQSNLHKFGVGPSSTILPVQNQIPVSQQKFGLNSRMYYKKTDVGRALCYCCLEEIGEDDRDVLEVGGNLGVGMGKGVAEEITNSKKIGTENSQKVNYSQTSITKYMIKRTPEKMPMQPKVQIDQKNKKPCITCCDCLKQICHNCMRKCNKCHKIVCKFDFKEDNSLGLHNC